MDLMTLRAKLLLDDSDYNKGLNSAEKKAGGFAKALGSGLKTVAKVGAVALAAAGTAAVAFAKNAVETGMVFDKSMSAVSATMGKKAHEMIEYNGQTMESIDALNAYALEMGRTTAFSASQAADALGYMALAGYNAEESMSMLPTVLNLAAAGDIELAYASDMVTDAQSALGLSMDQTTEMVNQMAIASSTTNTSVSQLGEAILTVGGTAKSLKGGTAELTQVLGLLADNGIKGAEGGTHLRNMMISLTKPTKDAQKQLKKLGVQVYDSNGEMRSMESIFGDLSTAMSKMTDKQKTEAINKIFNKTDLSAVNALLGTSAERWEEVGQAIADADGAAQDMANTKLDNLAGDITLFQSALEGAKIALSNKLTPALRKVVQYGTKAIERLTKAFDKGGFSGLVNELTKILSEVIGKIVDYVPKVIEIAGELLGALVTGFIKNLPKIAKAALQIIKTLGTSLVKNLPTIVGTIMTFVKGLADFIIDAIPLLLPAAIEMIVGLAGYLLDNIDKLIDAGINLIVGLVTGFVEAIPKLVEKIPELITKIVTAITNNLPALLQAGKDLIVELGKGMTGETNEEGSLIVALGQIGKKIITTIAGWATDLFNAGAGISKDISDGVESESGDDGSVLTSLKKLWKSIDTFLDAKSVETMNWEQAMLKKIWDYLLGSFRVVWSDIKWWLGMRKLDLQLWWDGIKTDVSTKIGNIKTTISTKMDEIKTKFTGKLTDLKTNAVTKWESIKETFKTALNKIKGFFNFTWELPKIKLPHFKKIGTGILGLPKIGVEWYKKAYETPYLFDKPTVVGSKGFGDGGGSGEMVYGRDALMRDIREAVGFTGNITININQRDGEDSMALARRIEQDLLKIMKAGKAGALYV